MAKKKKTIRKLTYNSIIVLLLITMVLNLYSTILVIDNNLSIKELKEQVQQLDSHYNN